MSSHTRNSAGSGEHEIEGLPQHLAECLKLSNPETNDSADRWEGESSESELHQVDSASDSHQEEQDTVEAESRSREVSMDNLDGTAQVLAGGSLHEESNDMLLERLCAEAERAQERFERQNDVEDIDEAIECWTRALSLTPNGHAERPERLDDLGGALFDRFRRVGEFEDLNKAIDYQTQALQLAPDGHARKPAWLNNLAVVCLSRFSNLGQLEDLDKAIDYSTQALKLIPDGHADKPTGLNTLGNTYHSRFERLGQLSDLDKAIDYQTQGVRLIPDGHVRKPARLHCLGVSYQSRFRRFGQLADIEKTIDIQTQAVQLTPDGHAEKPSRLGSLGAAYEYRFQRLGQLADLNKAINYKTQAVQLTPNKHVEKPIWLNSLGNSYLSRFGRLGELADLDKAIDCLTPALELTPDGHARKPTRLHSLGVSYQYRFERLGELADLNKAIDYHTQAVELTDDGHAGKPKRLNTLGTSYEFRFRQLDRLEDLDKAIDYNAQAVQLTPDGHAEKPIWISSLGISYEARFQHLGRLADLDKAIDYQTQAVQLTPDGHADQPMWLYNLGNAYWSRFMRLFDISDLKSAQSSFQDAAQLVVTSPELQLNSARYWAKSMAQLGQSPQLAYERCMELVPHLLWLGTTIHQRYQLLRKINDLATEAAAWAISAQQFDLALEWLEEGRSIVWGQVLQLRTPFDELSSVDSELAQRLKDTASELEKSGSRKSDEEWSDKLPVVDSDAQYHRLASDWEHLVGEARKLPGFEHFLRPRKASALKLAATNGPIVVINTHSTRCDALVIFPGSEDMAHIPLGRFLHEKSAQRQIVMGSLIGQRGDRERGFKKSIPQSRAEDTFQPVLAFLWSDVVKPILDFMGYTHPTLEGDLPHVTWCTTGALSFLPLHAAGSYDGLQPNVFDLVVSSYTPTLSALLTTSPVTSPDVGVLAVGQTSTIGFSPLPYTVQELAVIKEHAKLVPFQQLDGADGTVEAVLDALDRYSWVHLACHATQDPVNPTHSAFRLHNGNLTLEAITKCTFKNKGLAFLSACQTAAGDNELPDEAVHLAAGMLMAGYPSVIATMWSIYDQDAPGVADEVYTELLKDGKMDRRGAARALHKAVTGLREKVGVSEFKRWVPFIHIAV